MYTCIYTEPFPIVDIAYVYVSSREKPLQGRQRSYLGLGMFFYVLGNATFKRPPDIRELLEFHSISEVSVLQDRRSSFGILDSIITPVILCFVMDTVLSLIATW